MKIFYLIALVLCIAGCGLDDYQQPDWKLAPTEYTCTDEQYRRVERDTNFCNATTDYFGAYCYGAAIIRNCTVKVSPASN